MSDAVDHATPFFLSHARADKAAPVAAGARHPDQPAEQFFFDLSENVGQLISLPAGAEIGFMKTGMRGGAQWSDELMHALGTCQVLVPLLSVPYLSSEWCGKEWYAFTRRTVRRLDAKNANLHQGCIIPVIWAPIPRKLPMPVSDDMIFAPSSRPDPNLPAGYWTNGIFGLRRMGMEDSYRIIVWQLAMHISNVFHGQRLEYRKFRRGDLRNIFQGDQND